MNRALIMIAIVAVAWICPAQPPRPSSSEQQLFHLLNGERQRAGVEKLQWNAKLAEAAQAHAEQLARHGELSHSFPGEPLLEQRVGSTGERFDAVAENVAMAETEEDAHAGLMNSPGHRANILGGKYNAVGIGVVRTKNRVWVTQDFARVLPEYSPQQFREGVIAAFNRLRQAHRFSRVISQPDSRLDGQACEAKLDPARALEPISGASSATVFTATRPFDLPPTMEKAAADPALRRMNIGVCYHPGSDRFAKFWVVATFHYSQ